MAEWKTAGKVRMTPKGVHDSTIAYNILDLVSNEDHTMYYIAKQDVPANTLLTNTDYWDVVMDVDENVYTKSELDFKLPFGVESITVGDTILDNVTLSMQKDGDEDWYISNNISGLTTTNFKKDNYYILEIDGVSKLCRGEYLPSGYPDFNNWHDCTVVGDLGLIGKRCATPEEIAALPEGTVVHGGYYATFDNRFPEFKFDDYCIARRFKNDNNFNLYTSDTSATHTVTLKAATVVFTQVPSYLSGMNGVARYTNDNGMANTSLGNAGLQPSNKDTVYAEGIRNYVSQQATHAEGVLNVASGFYAHAEGSQNVASGGVAHAEGRQNVASGLTSHVGGMLNNDTGNFQTVIGVSANPSNDSTDKIIDKDNYYQSGCKKHVLVVGNGSMDYDHTNKMYFASSRSNAHTLDWHGNAEYAGDVKANACGGQNPVSLVEVSNDVTDLKSAFSDNLSLLNYATKSFSIANGTSHNYNKDVCSIGAKSGEKIQVTVNTSSGVGVSCQIFAKKSDNTFQKLSNATTDTDVSYTLTYDIVGIGVYFGTQGSALSVSVIVNKDGSFLYLPDDIADMKDFASKMSLKTGYTASTSFSVNSGSTHSSNNDVLKVLVPANGSFDIATNLSPTDATRTAEYKAFYSNGTSATILSGNTEHSYRITTTSEMIGIGVFINAVSENTVATVSFNYAGEDLQSKLTDANAGADNFKWYAAFVNGGLSSGSIQTANKNRVATPNILSFDRDIIVTPKSGFKFGIHTFVGGVFSADSGWQTVPYAISANTTFKIVIARVTEDSNEIADIETFTGSVLFDTPIGHRVTLLEDAVSATPAYYYEGEIIDVKKHGYNVSSLYAVPTKPSDTDYQQGFAVFDGVLFQLYANDYVILANFSDGSIIATLPITSSHGDTIDFSNEYYDPDDEFPLAYITADTTPAVVYVVRITRSATTLIRTIYFADTAKTGYYAGHCLDADTNILYTVGYAANSYSDATGNKMIVSVWDCNNLTDNGDDTYTPAFIRSFYLPFLTTIQGQRFFNNRLWLLSSATSNVSTIIYGVAPELEKIVTTLSSFPSQIKNVECEGIEFVLDNDRYDLIISNYSYYKITFNV